MTKEDLEHGIKSLEKSNEIQISSIENFKDAIRHLVFENGCDEYMITALEAYTKSIKNNFAIIEQNNAKIRLTKEILNA